MNILGISAYYHDSAAAIIRDGKIIAAAQEERFTRKKHDPGFPTNAIKYCLEYSGLELSQLDAVVFFLKTIIKIL
ncbi:MAG: carbamoyltransferase N-terminal domain-containing protein, partial [Leadbetterella sp.]